MSRRKAAGLAALVALLLAATYLLTQRRGRGPEPVPAAPPTLVPTPPTVLKVDPSAPEVAVPPAETDPKPAPRKKPEPRSWGTSRGVLAPTPPTAPPPAPVVAAAVQGDAVEQPLPTWLRFSIVAAALLAFFAVSLIATKQV